MRVEQGFQPIPFSEGNVFTLDPVLPSLLKRLFPESISKDVESDLVRLGAVVPTSIRALGAQVAPPRFIQYNQWGQRIDELQTSEGWRALKAYIQSEGILGTFYERKYGELSRVYGFMKVLMLMGDSHEVFCPLSMTDGAARILELLGSPEIKRTVLPRLISSDPSTAFTSGQWMTERPGGSDVSQTETVAAGTGNENLMGPEYKLDGFKWFSSATDSEVAVALARTGSRQSGSRGLSLFLVPLRLPLLLNPGSPPAPSTSNGIYTHRLKSKIGTHILPTAELSLESTEAYLVGPLNQGVKSITPVLNITRIYSAIASAGALRKCLAIATSYANVRAIHGGEQLLKDNPLHVSRLVSISMVYRAITHLSFGVIRLLGKVECGIATPGEQGRIRILTPVVKAFAAEKACNAMEEAMAALGGAGYMEENGIGVAIRDALVEKIWEGTTTVLSLDLVRAAQDSFNLQSFISWGKEITSAFPLILQDALRPSLDLLNTGLNALTTMFSAPIPTLLPYPAILFLGHLASSLYLLEHASWSFNHEVDSSTDIDVFNRSVLEGGLREAMDNVNTARNATSSRVAANSAIVFGSTLKGKL